MFLAMLLVLLVAVQAPVQVDITEWTVPWENTRPRDPAVGDAENIWFVGQQGHYVGHLNPKTGQFKKYDLPSGAGPHNVIVGRDGGIWYSGNLQGYIGKLDPKTGEVKKYDMPNPAARDPHTLILDSAGFIWFTVQNGNFIGRFSHTFGET